MIKIHRRIEYALIALRHMYRRRPGELTQAKELSKMYDAPFDTISRVMQLMAQKGILRAEQGAHGGYQITKDLSQVTFYDLVQIVLGSSVEIAPCLDHNGDCEFTAKCNIIPGISYLNTRILYLYRTISVHDLIKERSANEIHDDKNAVAFSHKGEVSRKDSSKQKPEEGSA